MEICHQFLGYDSELFDRSIQTDQRDVLLTIFDGFARICLGSSLSLT